MTIKRFLGALLTLFALYLLLLWLEVLPRIDADQQAAIAALSGTPPFEGRNAFGEIWFARREVKPENIDQLLREDVATWNALSPEAQRSDKLDLHATRLPALPKLDGDLICGVTEPECLDKIRALAESIRAALLTQQSALAAAERLQQAGHIQALARQTPLSHYGDWPGMQALFLQIGLRFVDGDPLGAQQELCRQVIGWRRLRANTDILLQSVIGAAYVERAAALFAEMRAQLPIDAELPGNCQAAFAPLQAAEMNLCAVMKGEQRYAEYLLRTYLPGVPSQGSLRERLFSGLYQLGHHTEHTLARLAVERARACPIPNKPIVRDCTRLESLFNPSGCAETRGQEDLPTWEQRLTKLDLRLRLLNITLTWPITPDTEQATLIERWLPRADQEQMFTFDGDAGLLRLSQPTEAGERSFSFPLPASRIVDTNPPADDADSGSAE